MNFTNIRKICLKELKESLQDNRINVIPLGIIFFIIFAMSSKSIGDVFNIGELISVFCSVGITNSLIKLGLIDELLLGKFSSLLALPMSLKEIFLGKYLAITILSFFSTIIGILIFKIASLLLYGRMSLNLILISVSFLLFVIIQIYFAISALLSLKYKSRALGILIRLAPFILFIITLACGFLYMQRTGLLDNPEFFNSLNQTAQPSNVSSSTNLIILSNPLFWIIGGGLSGIIILILLFIMLYLLNRLNKEKILI
ncbi:MAG: hypothetical protein LBD03_03145 [Methanobrevibacter sp.]|jgi:hypothetical protein|nr:hypothetical protein [Candidatus Methanovirga procula]